MNLLSGILRYLLHFIDIKLASSCIMKYRYAMKLNKEGLLQICCIRLQSLISFVQSYRKIPSWLT